MSFSDSMLNQTYATIFISSIQQVYGKVFAVAETALVTNVWPLMKYSNEQNLSRCNLEPCCRCGLAYFGSTDTQYLPRIVVRLISYPVC